MALAPDGAEGHRKLGERYRRRQDAEKAIGAFRAAITKNDRLFLVYFDLAELLLARGTPIRRNVLTQVAHLRGNRPQRL